MKLNEKHVVTCPEKSCWLVPYDNIHVPKYHTWMQDDVLRELTASESLSLKEEYEMQKSWRDDNDKLTFLILDSATLEREYKKNGKARYDSTSPVYLLCQKLFGIGEKLASVEAAVNSTWSQIEANCLIGDINLFIDWEEKTGEINLMIAEEPFRSRGYGKTSFLAFVYYVKQHLSLSKLIARISESNEASILFFTKLSRIDPCEKRIDILGGHAWHNSFYGL